MLTKPKAHPLSASSYQTLGYMDAIQSQGSQRLPRQDSQSSPYRVTWLRQTATKTPFQICMSMHPGRRDRGLTVEWDRSLDVDLQALKELGVKTILCTVEQSEFELLGIPDYIKRAEKAGFDVIWFPIRDVSVPLSQKLALKALEEVFEALQSGHVLIHCRGGKGRTGVMAVCLLELLGHSFPAALDLVRSAKPDTVETRLQESWCKEFADYVGIFLRGL